MCTGQETYTTADVFSNYRDTRVLVLGAAGFVGRWVARTLGGHGARLALVVRDRESAQAIFSAYGIEGELVEADLAADPAQVRTVFERFRPSITFNLAGYGVDRSERDEDPAYRVNEHLVRNVCETIAGLRDVNWPGQDIVHAGSALEYGETSGDLQEDCTPNPTTLYGRSKLAGTRALSQCCDRRGVKGVTARLFMLYGPGEHAGRLLPALLETTRSGQVLEMTTGLQQRDFTYVEDVAEGLLRLGVTSAPGGKVVNLATGRLSAVREFVETAARVLSIPGDKLRFGAIPTREEEMAHLPVSVERLKKTINWVPGTDIGDGIRRTAEFYTDNKEG